MQWEHLTAPEFERAVRETDLCIIPMGVLEKHGEHLPVGTDMLVAHRLACLAAEKEPAVVFPPWFIGQIYEARCYPGCVTISPRLTVDFIEAICDEIGRNGFRKILFLDGHGGNYYLMHFLAQCSLWEKKPYSIYETEAMELPPEAKREWDAVLSTRTHLHACECETSLMMAWFGELVDRKAIPPEPSESLARTAHLGGMMAGVSWYSKFPTHYAGDARTASAEKGRKLARIMVGVIAERIAAVKADKVVPALEAEFHDRAANPCTPRRRK